MKIERIKQIYDEIQGYGITLVSDPTAHGARYLQDQIATCRNHLNAVSVILLEIHREKHNLTSEVSGEEAIYSIESNEMLTNDERVRRLPSIEDRRAAISVLLRERVAKIAELKRQIQDLDYVEKAVKHRHKELKDTMGEIKLQRSLIRDEIDTRSFFGDERVQGKSGGSMVADDDLSADEIQSLLEQERASDEAAKQATQEPTSGDDEDGVEDSGEVVLPDPEPAPESISEPAPEPAPEPDPAPTTDDIPSLVAELADTTTDTPSEDEQAIEAFLAEGAPPPAAKNPPPEDDFSDIFDRL